MHPFTHDLSELLDALEELGLEAPERVRDAADALTPHYTMARYPGRKPVSYDERRGRRCLEQARRVAMWVEEQADP